VEFEGFVDRSSPASCLLEVSQEGGKIRRQKQGPPAAFGSFKVPCLDEGVEARATERQYGHRLRDAVRGLREIEGMGGVHLSLHWS